MAACRKNILFVEDLVDHPACRGGGLHAAGLWDVVPRGDLSRIVVMQHVTQEHLQEFLDDMAAAVK